MARKSTSKHALEITYEGFVHAMTDKPQYFPAFLDRASSIARNIGVCDSGIKEEFAIVAIEHLWSKIDKYDPSRGEFVKFFNECVGNKILDQINSANRDKVFGLKKPLRGAESCGESVSDEEESRLLKKREFVDGMISEFKIFIDSLSPENKAMLCASEFGKLILGEESSGGSYADQMAARTGRTAAAVRKAVERLKKDAISFVQKRGFDYDTYATQVKYYIKIEDKTVSPLDWTALSGVQRLKLRMYLYEKALADGIIEEE